MKRYELPLRRMFLIESKASTLKDTYTRVVLPSSSSGLAVHVASPLNPISVPTAREEVVDFTMYGGELQSQTGSFGSHPCSIGSPEYAYICASVYFCSPAIDSRTQLYDIPLERIGNVTGSQGLSTF